MENVVLIKKHLNMIWCLCVWRVWCPWVLQKIFGLGDLHWDEIIFVFFHLMRSWLMKSYCKWQKNVLQNMWHHYWRLVWLVQQPLTCGQIKEPPILFVWWSISFTIIGNPNMWGLDCLKLTSNTINATLAKQLHELLEKFDITKKNLCDVKDEGANWAL